MRRSCALLFFLLCFATLFARVEAAQVEEILVAEQPYLLQLRGNLIRSSSGDRLEQGLWLTEAITENRAKQFRALQTISRSRLAYRLLALDAQKELLSETSFIPSGSIYTLRVDLVLPPKTAYVELRAPDGSLVKEGLQMWPQMDQAPKLQYLYVSAVDPKARSLRVNWRSQGACDGYTLWYTADGVVWYHLLSTTETSAELELDQLPGGVLEGAVAELCVLASRGLATESITQRVVVGWLLPEVQIRDVSAGAVLSYDRGELIDLMADAWDEQERWLIADRIIWMDDLGQILGQGDWLRLSAGLFPVGLYEITAMTMNQQELFAGQVVYIEICSGWNAANGYNVDFDDEDMLWVPLRWAMHVAGWSLAYDAERQEIVLGNYYTSYTIRSNGELWQEGLFRGQLRLKNAEGTNWISSEDLRLLGFADTLWDEQSKQVTFRPNRAE